MAIERTFSIIKPNAVAKNVIGNIFARFEAAGFKIVGTKMLHLTVEQARGFYAEHDGKPFFDGLVEFMTSGPIVVSVLEGADTGAPVPATGSPGFKPVVSSYTSMVVRSEVSPMTSPTSLPVPT